MSQDKSFSFDPNFLTIGFGAPGNYQQQQGQPPAQPQFPQQPQGGPVSSGPQFPAPNSAVLEALTANMGGRAFHMPTLLQQYAKMTRSGMQFQLPQLQNQSGSGSLPVASTVMDSGSSQPRTAPLKFKPTYTINPRTGLPVLEVIPEVPELTPTKGPNLFGQQQSSTSGAFGGSNVFGQNKPFSFGSPPLQSGFGAASPQSGFGATPNQSGFGANLNQSGFGSPNQSGFGAALNQSGFGAAPTQSGFLSQQPPQTASTPFQSASSNFFGPGNPFGGPEQLGTLSKFSPVNGADTMQRGGVALPINTKIHCITCMPEYENKSFEELRSEDYAANRKGPQQTPPFSSTSFAAPSNTPTTSILTGFGQIPVFNFPPFTSSFGASTQTSTSNTFGKPTVTTGTFSFANPTNNVFSGSQQQKPFALPLFGPTATQPQGIFGTSAFGQTNANLFQKPAEQPPQFTVQNVFGNQHLMPQTTNLFQSKGNTGFGLYGQGGTGTPNFGPNGQPALGKAGTSTFGTTTFGQLGTSAFGQPGTSTFGLPGTSTFGPPGTSTFGPPGTSSFGQPGTSPFGQLGTSSFGQLGTSSFGQLGTSSFGQLGTRGFGTSAFGQPGPGIPLFGQTNQLNSDFGKPAAFGFGQLSLPAFGPSLGGAFQQPSLQGNGTTKPSFFGGSNFGASLYPNSLLQLPQNSFSMTPAQLQPTQLPTAAEAANQLSLAATDSFPDSPHLFGLEPILTPSKTNTTNQNAIKSVLEVSKEREELAGVGAKIRVNPPKPRRSMNLNKDFFEAKRAVRTSHKCLIIRKFNNDNVTIYNKYRNELLEEAQVCLETSKNESETDFSTPEETLQVENSVSTDLSNIGPVTSDASTNIDNLNFDVSDLEKQISSTDSVEVEVSKTKENDDLSLFSNISDTPFDEIIIGGPSGVILTRPEYYMNPTLNELSQHIDDMGNCVVQGLTIGRRGYGNVYFPDPIDITNMNLDEIIHFRHREVIIYPDEATKPPVGTGLNRRAQVTLDKIYPRHKGSNEYITDVRQIIQSNFVDNLMSVTQKHDCKFVDYRPKTGSWVFKVQHFSRYAFTDSDEDECELDEETAKKIERNLLQKVKEVEEVPSVGLIDFKAGGDCNTQISLEKIKGKPCLTIPKKNRDLICMDLFQARTKDVRKPQPVFVHKNEHGSCQVLTEPRYHTLEGISGVQIFPVIHDQRCYMELAVYHQNTFKVGWSSGCNFYQLFRNTSPIPIFSITSNIIETGNKSEYDCMIPDPKHFLLATLEESEFSFDENNVPTLEIKKGGNFLNRQTELFNEYANSKHLHGNLRYASDVLNLCLALWGAGDYTPYGRRVRFSNWLKKSAFDLAYESDRQDVFDEVARLLSFHKVSEASQFASENNLHQLSLIISQLSANQLVKRVLTNEMESQAWIENVIPDNFKKLYLLLAGKTRSDELTIYGNLDWVRCLGLHLWYIAPSASPIDTAFKQFKAAFLSDNARKPLSQYSPDHYDLLYHILNVYVNSTYQLRILLDPQTHTGNIMDYRLSWILLQLFLSLKVGLIRESEQEFLHVSFANQLDSMGEWQWAIFVLLFLKNNVVKKDSIMKILHRHLALFQETSESEIELVETLRIPPSWIHEVKAYKAKNANRHYEHFRHASYSGNFYETDDVFVEHILPDFFISEQYDEVKDLISKYENESVSLEYWYTRAGMFREFIELEEFIRGRENLAGFRIICGKLMSLIKRINCFKVKHDKHRLCIAELSRKCALIFQFVGHKIQNIAYIAEFSELFNKLHMPADYRHYEAFRFIDAVTGGYI